MSDEEYFAARLRLRQVLGRMKALRDDTPLPFRVAQHLHYAIKSTEDALKALRGSQPAPRGRIGGT
jgi:hypothetical protein